MSPQTLMVRHDMFYQKRRKDVEEILANLLEDSIITDFKLLETLNGINNNVRSWVEIKDNPNKIYVSIYKSSFDDFIGLSSQDSSTISLLIGDNKTTWDLYLYLKGEIKVLANGIYVEKLFCADANSLVAFKVTDASNDENQYQGIDFWIHFNGKLTPIQIKSSIGGIRKHKKKHPKIPALIYGENKFTMEELRKHLVSICNNYSKGIIEHVIL